MAAVIEPQLRPFSWFALLRGVPVYEFDEFYVAKDHLLRYDARTGYCNYGLWTDGDATPNPSAALVARLLDALAPAPGARLLDVGSGLGQPAIDAARRAPDVHVVGVNRSVAQVGRANARAAEAGLGDRVQHVVADAHALGEVPGGPFDGAISVEALAEMPELDRVLAGLHAALAPGARVAVCDIVRNAGRGPLRRALSVALRGATRLLYGDAWRTTEELHAAFVGAGFRDVRVERVGAEVFAPTWRWAAPRLAGLRAVSRRAGSAGLLAWWNLRGLDRLHRLGEVDYVVLVATR